MTIRDNDNTGYNSDKARERDVEQKREQERMAKEAVPGVPVEDPRPPRDNPEEHLDRFDAANVGDTPVGVSEDAWEVVLRRLAHMQAQDTNHLLSAKTMDALWEKHGESTP